MALSLSVDLDCVCALLFFFFVEAIFDPLFFFFLSLLRSLYQASAYKCTRIVLPIEKAVSLFFFSRVASLTPIAFMDLCNSRKSKKKKNREIKKSKSNCNSRKLVEIGKRALEVPGGLRLLFSLRQRAYKRKERPTDLFFFLTQNGGKRTYCFSSPDVIFFFFVCVCVCLCF